MQFPRPVGFVILVVARYSQTDSRLWLVQIMIAFLALVLILCFEPTGSTSRMTARMNSANMANHIGREEDPCALRYQVGYPSYEQRRGLIALSKCQVKCLASYVGLMIVKERR